MGYERNVTAPMATMATATIGDERKPTIPMVISKLEELSKEAAELLERLQGRFSLVIVSRPSNQDTNAARIHPTMSDLASMIRTSTDSIEKSFTGIRELIDSCDL